MKITAVTVTLPKNEDLKVVAFARVVFDDEFVVGDIKVIRNRSGGMFLSMPTRPCKRLCHACPVKNDIRYVYCSKCGAKLVPFDWESDPSLPRNGRVDVAHPLGNTFRQTMFDAIIREYHRATDWKQSPSESSNEVHEEAVDRPD